MYTCDLLTTTDGEQESYLYVIQIVMVAAPKMLNAQDKHGGNTPIDFVQDLKPEKHGSGGASKAG